MADGQGDARAVTRDDVARRAGVSSAVVSYVLTGARRVRPDTEARVRAAIDELAYRPNRNARALKTGRSDMLGVVLTDITNPYFAEFAMQIEIAAARRGHAVLIVNSQARLERELDLVDDLLDRGVDGLIINSVLAAESRKVVEGLDSRVVWIDDTDTDAPQSTVASSMLEGAAEVVRHLIQVHGRQRIALVIGDGQRIETDARELGWLAALEEAGLTPGPRVTAAWSRQGGFECGHELFALADAPDAIFACSDLMGIGVLRAAADRGIAVPQQVALASYDGSQESEFSIPALTTLRQPIPLMAQAAVDAVLDDGEPQHSMFRGEVIVRESCGCLPPH